MEAGQGFLTHACTLCTTLYSFFLVRFFNSGSAAACIILAAVNVSTPLFNLSGNHSVPRRPAFPHS